jgi:hypothetical protein
VKAAIVKTTAITVFVQDKRLEVIAREDILRVRMAIAHLLTHSLPAKCFTKPSKNLFIGPCLKVCGFLVLRTPDFHEYVMSEQNCSPVQLVWGKKKCIPNYAVHRVLQIPLLSLFDFSPQLPVSCHVTTAITRSTYVVNGSFRGGLKGGMQSHRML